DGDGHVSGACDLVPGGGDVGDEPRVSLGDPTEDEARRTGAVFIEDAQDEPGLVLDQRWERGPRGGVLDGVDLDEMEPILDVEGEGVEDGGRRIHQERTR